MSNNRILIIASWVSIGLVIAISLYVFFLMLYPFKTADVTEPIPVLNENNIVMRGEKLQVELTITKFSTVTPTVSRNIICDDGRAYFVPSSIVGTARPVGASIASTGVVLPGEIPADVHCLLQFNNEYKVNALRTINRVWESEKFVVKEVR